MSRYCFYCGKELEPGERCSCRYSQKAKTGTSSGTAGRQTGSPQRAGASNPDQSASATDWKTAAGSASASASQSAGSTAADSASAPKRTWYDRIRQKKQSRSGHSTRYSGGQAGPGAGYRPPFGFAGAGAGASAAAAGRMRNGLSRILYQLKLFFQNPDQAIGESIRAHWGWLVVLVVLECSLVVAMTWQMIGRSNLGNLLVFAALRPDSQLNLTALLWNIAVLEMLFILLWFLIRSMSYHLILRATLRRIRPYADVLHMLTPGIFYYTIFLLVGNVLASGSGIATILLIICGIGIRFLVDYLAISKLTSESTVRLFIPFAIAVLIQAFLVGALLRLMLPNVAGFNFTPASRSLI